MIEKIYDKENLIGQIYELNLKNESGILVFKVDSEKWSLEQAQEYLGAIMKAFPKIKILMTFDGMELKGVINESN